MARLLLEGEIPQRNIIYSIVESPEYIQYKKEISQRVESFNLMGYKVSVEPYVNSSTYKIYKGEELKYVFSTAIKFKSGIIQFLIGEVIEIGK